MELLNHKIYGEGDPVVIIHGLFGMSDNWSNFAKQLAEIRMVILIDVRDHGRSPHSESFSYPAAAEDIIRLLENNWIYRADFIGHSMGGKIAMQLAADFPDFVEKLVIVDIAPVAYTGGHENIINALLSVNIGSVKSRNEVEEFLFEKLGDLNIVRFLLKNLTRQKSGGFKWKMNLKLLSESYDIIMDQPILDQIQAPTLFIKGENSTYIDSKGEDAIKSIFTDFDLISIAEAGHWVHADQPEKLYDHVVAFLNGE